MPVNAKLIQNIKLLRDQLNQQIIENNYSLQDKEIQLLSEKINNLVLVYHASQLQKQLQHKIS